MQLALFEPDIPQNTGSLIRLSACMGVTLHIIEPCGFPFDPKRFRRVAMDYYDLAKIERHVSWQAFLDANQNGRLVLLSTRAEKHYCDFSYGNDDILLLGRESSGVPEHVRAACAARVKIPMQNGARSLNVAQAASMILGEALRQVNPRRMTGSGSVSENK